MDDRARTSADKAERIYDQKQRLRDLEGYLAKLDVQVSTAQDPAERDDLDARISEMAQRRDDLIGEIDELESDYQAWLADQS